jgi:NADH-quinone oxidoreductase subunit G
MRLVEPMHIASWQDSAVREALENEPTGPLYIGSMHQTKLDSLARYTYHSAPEDLARLGFAVAHILDEKAPAVPDFEPELQPLAEEIALALRQAQRPLVISGVSSGSEAVLQAAANVAWALHGADLPAHLALVFPEVNSLGLALLGDGDLEEALKQIQDGAAETVVVLENDLYRRAPAEDVSAMLAKSKNVVVLDHLETGITAEAGTVLPAATFAESDGTYVNNESRAQPAYQVFVPDGDVQASWLWLGDLLAAQGQAAWTSWDDLVVALAQSEALFAPLTRIAPPAGFRIHGQRIPRQPQRYSGRGAIHAAENVSEPQPPQDPDTPLAFSMEGSEQQPPPALIARYWASGWNSVQALNRFQEEIAGPLRGGELGQRLIEPAQDSPPGDESPGFFAEVPAAFEPRADEWCLLPLYHIFGSDELSLKTPGISERAPEPYLALNPDDAERAGLAEGHMVALDASLVLPIRYVPSLPTGTAGLPVGLTAYWEVNRSVGIRRYQAQDGGNQP